MAYEFKKLSEVEKLDSVPDGATVLAEVDGAIRRVPGEGLGGSGTIPEDFLSEQEMLIEIMPSIDMGFGYVSQYDVYGGALSFGETGSSNEETIAKFPCTVGDKCVVIWDSIQYEVTVIDTSSAMPGTIGGIGNGVNFGLPGNGEPFVIGWDENGVMFISLTDTEALVHTIAIYQKKTSEKIDTKYLPDIPEFDLAAMGLPAVPLDGSYVSVECDITEIQEAAKKGLIKIKAIVSAFGMELTMESFATSVFVIESGGCMLSVIGLMDGTPFIVSAEIFGGMIQASGIPMATLTTATT